MLSSVHTYLSSVGQAWGEVCYFKLLCFVIEKILCASFSPDQQGDQSCLGSSKEQHHFPLWKLQRLLQCSPYAGVPSCG